MTLRKGLLILAFLTASEFMFIGCSEQNKQNLEAQLSEKQEDDALEKILISEYDPIMRRIAQENGMDWRLLAAIGYQESRFRNDVVSTSGAVGLMQVMPAVAASFGVKSDSISIPEVNIKLAVKVIKSIEGALMFSSSTPIDDRIKVVLACYNGGIGHVIDARRLAAKYGANYNSWSELSNYLKIKGSPEYVEDEAVRCGAFNSGETIAFVDAVISQYKLYCSQYPESNNHNSQQNKLASM